MNENHKLFLDMMLMAFSHGRADGRFISRREADERWPGATSEEMDVLLNAHEDGVHDDAWRLRHNGASDEQIEAARKNRRNFLLNLF